jgi:hypothetical protein
VDALEAARAVAVIAGSKRDRRRGGECQRMLRIGGRKTRIASVNGMEGVSVAPIFRLVPQPKPAGRGLLLPGSSNRTVKTDAGTTPADHIEAVRVEAACRLLETTRSSIEQIARTCGSAPRKP